MKALADRLGIQRIVVLGNFLAPQYRFKAFADGKQVVLEMRPRPGNHVFDRDRVFQVVEFNQGQFVFVVRLLDQFSLADELVETQLHFIVEMFLQAVAFDTDLAHRLEIHIAFAIVVDLVRKFEQRIVDAFH